ncbi:MAG TPA: EF-hand domain-containing protein [Burkholderiaceae bacterium]|nr:EF-hand domain-containing protein [Burkholderiaceae bacterium]
MGIGSIGNTQDPQASWSAQRPDPAQLAQKLFSQLDTSGQGYLDASDLQSAMDKVSLSAQGQAMSARDLMAKMDTDGDGKITESEFANALQSAAQQVGGHHGHHHHHAHGVSGSNSSSQDPDGDGDRSSQGAPGSESASSDGGGDTARIMGRIMQLMQAYNPPGAAPGSSNRGSSTSSTAGVA